MQAHGYTAIDEQLRPRHKPAQIAGEEHGGPAQVLGLADAPQGRPALQVRQLPGLRQVVPGQLGPRRPRQERVAPDPVPPQRARLGLHHGEDRRLRRRVVHLLRAPQVRADAADPDDAAAPPLRHHLLSGRLRRPERPADVGLQVRFQGFFVESVV